MPKLNASWAKTRDRFEKYNGETHLRCVELSRLVKENKTIRERFRCMREEMATKLRDIIITWEIIQNDANKFKIKKSSLRT